MVLDIKPISNLEMPEYYSKQPVSRFLYSMKSYRIKQLNFMYRNSIKLMGDKNTFKRGLRNMIRYNTALIAAGIPLEIILNMMQDVS